MVNSIAQSTLSFKTIIDFLRFGITQAHNTPLFFGHGTDNASDEMWWLILGALSLPIDCDPILLQANLTPDEKEKLINLLTQRLVDRIPVPYLINQANFCNLSFYVDKRVLIPRSPIAELINQHFSPWLEVNQVQRILDLCTGSGCIAIACCYAFPDAQVDAVDLSPEALQVAALNREQHGLEDSLTLIESDCWQNIPDDCYDIIVSNPPYVSVEEMQSLPAEYLHEPKMALQADSNGLAIVEKILVNAHRYLSEQGILVMEVGNGEEALMDLFPQVPFTWLDFEQGGSGVFLLTAQQLEAHFGNKS